MIPYSYHMVDMGGIDLAEANGIIVEGLYNRLAIGRNACGDLILYNWKFAGIEIAPSACSTIDAGTSILINGLIQVTEQDEVSIPGIVPDPVISSLSVTENGTYNPPSGVDGYAPVIVDVPDPVISSLSVTENGTYTPPTGVDGYAPVEVNVGGSDPALPSEYQEVEYLTFSGQEYILVENLPESYLLHVLFSVVNTSEYVAVGYREQSNSPQDFELRSSSGMFGLWVRSSAYGYIYAPSFPIGGSTGVSVSKEVIVSLTQPRKKFFIGKYSTEGLVYALNGRIYHINMYPAQTSGSFTSFKTIMEFVPCYRKSDNEPGFYELYTQTFYTNDGTGAFVVGPDVN